MPRQTRTGRRARPGCRLKAALGLLVVLAGGVGRERAIEAQNPADLFWEAEAPLAVMGGGNVPGQITGRPEVERPTSLALAKAPLVRLDFHSQTPIAVEQGQTTVARWQTEVMAQECVIPLQPESQAERWVVGLRNRSSRGTVEDHQPDLDWRLSLDDDKRTLAVAWATTSGWVLGCAAADSTFRSRASGASVAQVLSIPPDTTDWPRLRAETMQWTFGVSRSGRPLRWGIQYAAVDPDVNLRVTRAGSHYTARLPADGHRLEAYAALDRGDDTFFATGTDTQGHARGSVLLGLAARGDLQVSTKDSSVGLGWRRERDGRTVQAIADWRRSSVHTVDQGYAGLFPGFGTDVYAAEADARAETFSLRGGAEWPLRPHWSLLSGLSAHHTALNGQWRLRESGGIGQNPRTVSEFLVDDGALDMVALSLGIQYEDQRCSCILAGSFGHAVVNQALKSAGGGRPGPDQKPSRFEPEPLLAFSAEYRF